MATVKQEMDEECSPAEEADATDTDPGEDFQQDIVVREESAGHFLSFLDDNVSDERKTLADVTTQTDSVPKFRAIITFERLSAKQILHFTEFSHDQFNALYNFLSKSKCMSSDFLNKFKLISPIEQLLMTLYKYRLNHDFKMIGAMFNVTPLLACKIFKHWNAIINICLTDIDFWSLGKTDGTKYRVCLHCVKVFLDSDIPESDDRSRKPFYPATSVRHRCLIGINEGGIVIFCSKLFRNNVSSKEMFVSSQLLRGLERGDEILTSSDFGISDLLSEKGVKKYIAPFIVDTTSIQSPESCTLQISGRKIHTDRLANLVTTYRILAEPIENELIPISSDIIYNCAMLCNFRPKKK